MDKDNYESSVDLKHLNDSLFQVYVEGITDKYGPYILEKNCDYKSTKLKHPVAGNVTKLIDKIRVEFFRRQEAKSK